MRELLGERPNATTSGAGNAGGTTAPDTALAVFDDDHFNDSFYLLLTSGTNADENRPVSDFATSGGVMTGARAYTGQVASGVSYELLRYSPDDYLAAVNMASWQLYPRLYRVVYNEEHSVGSILLNPSFETAIAAADWTSSGSPTITYLTTTLMHGRAVNIVAGGSAGQVYQDWTDRLRESRGMGVTFGGLVRTTAVDTARLRLDWDGTNFQNHSYHSGDDEWQWQEIGITVPATATRIRAICEVAANGTAQFDAMYLIFHNPLRIRYDIGTTMRDGPSALYVAQDKTYNPLYAGWTEWPYYYIDGASDPNANNDSGPANSVGRYIVLTQRPKAGLRLRMVGMAPLTAATADATNIEVDQPQVTRLAVRASKILLEMQLAKLGGRAAEEIDRSLARLSALDSQMEGDPRLWTQRPKVMARNLIRGIW